MDIKELMEQMTLDEKIGQLVVYETNIFAAGNERKDVVLGPLEELGLEEKFLKYAGSALTIYHAEQMIKIQKKHMADDRHHIPMLFMLDVIHGFRTIYPIPLAMGASFDPNLMAECAEISAKEAASIGVSIALSPMVDVVRDPRWGRVMESFGESALVNGVMGSAQVRAMQENSLADSNSVAVCVKHFAAYGAAEGGRDYNTVEISERILREYYLPAYKACLDSGAKAIMPAFESLNGVPVIANSFMMKRILRDEWGFHGLVISDYDAVRELCVHGVAANLKEAAKMAIDNGVTIEMMSSGYQSHLKKLIQDGVIDEQTIDRLVEDVLNFKYEMGLFEDPYRGASEEMEKTVCLTEKNRSIARRAAEECAVLLKNESILPFSEKTKKIALIGPYAQTQRIKGNWSFTGRKEDCVSVKCGIEKLLPDAQIVVVEACTFDDREYSILDAVRAAESAEVVILCLGEDELDSGESKCRTDLGLSKNQMELAKAVLEVNQNVAVVLFNGRPLVLTELNDIAPAILEMWFPGIEGGNAVANLLFGRTVPCGKISMSFPRAVGQIPVYHDAPSTGRPKKEQDGKFEICLSNYIDCGNLPLYSLGYGLSYTSFVYSDFLLDRKKITDNEVLTVSVTVQNTGSRRGKEVVQLYLRDLVACAIRPVQQLIAFKKIELIPGESKNVTFEIAEPMLRFYDVNCNCVSEAGEFQISVGYADHMVFSDTFELIK